MFHLFELHVLWDGSDEDIVRHKFLLVGSKKLLVELEGSALLLLSVSGIDLKVSHLLTGSLKVLKFLNLDDSRVEWSGDVSSDLRSWSNNDSSFLLENHGELGRVGLLLWEVV